MTTEQQSAAVLLTHIEYIRETVDEVKGDVKTVVKTANDHETRLQLLEDRTPKRRGFWGTGGFVAGLLAGLGFRGGA